MSGIIKSPLKYSVAEGIYNDVITQNSRYYYFLGRQQLWPNPTDSAETPIDTQNYEMSTRNDILLMNLVGSSDVSFVVPRNIWYRGTVYDMFDDTYSVSNPSTTGAISLDTAKYFVVNSSDNVYKCISNSLGKPSIYEPTGQNPENITMADGYVWKFMYYIPIALQNKFYTASLMPVITSLKDSFYENGRISFVAVNNPGSGYSSGVTLTSQGDGYIEANPYAIHQNCIIDYPGHGYPSAPTVTISGPTHGGAFSSGINARIQATTSVFGSVTIDGSGAVTGITLDPHVDATSTAVYGSGYDLKGSLTISPPVISDITWAPNLHITSGQKVEVDYPSGPSKYYLATSTGFTDLTPPVFTSGSAMSGAVNLTYTATRALGRLSLTKTEGIFTPVLTPDGLTPPILNTIVTGTSWSTGIITYHTNTVHGLSTGNTISISNVVSSLVGTAYNGTYVVASTPTTTTFTVVEAVDPGTWISGGNTICYINTTYSITGVTVVDGGIGYSYVTILANDTIPNHSSIFSVDMSIGDINSNQANVEFSAVDGSLSSIVIINGGVGYTISGTTVTITGDGYSATAVPVISGGTITAITLIDYGHGYRKNIKVVISDSNNISNTTASARAVLSPQGGHGKNAIKELGANTLLFYAALADERMHKIQNLAGVYRQFGIIKNPTDFGASTRSTLTTITPCYLMTLDSTINTSLFHLGDTIYQTGADTYIITIIRGNQIVIQSVQNTIPTIVLPFINTLGGSTITALSIVAPEVDKFSGDMIFLDNKAQFGITSDQMVSFRTTIGF